MIRMNTVIAAAFLLTSGVHGAAFVSSHHSTKPSFVLHSARDDFYHEPHFETSPLVVEKYPRDRMLDCAQQGECTLEEMNHMIEDLSHDNHDDDAALKQALLLQRELASLQQELQKSVQPEAPHHDFPKADHAFQHYVDYKDIGAYESH